MSYIKKATLHQENSLAQNHNTPERGTKKHLRRNKESDRPIIIKDKTKNILLSSIGERAKQARRMIELLAKNPNTPTGQLNKKCGVNLSVTADRANKDIIVHGYCIDCIEPPHPILNALGEKSGQELWSIYKK